MDRSLTERPVSWTRVRPKRRCELHCLLRRRLIECCAAGVAETSPVPAQASSDCADIGNLAGTEPIDIRGAGAALLGRTLVLRKCCAAGTQRQEQAERATLAGAAGEGCKSQRSRLHAASPGSGWRRRGAFANHRRYRKRISPDVIFLTLGLLWRRVGSARRREQGSKARLQ